MITTVKIMLIDSDIPIPEQAYEGDAAYDLAARMVSLYEPEIFNENLEIKEKFLMWDLKKAPYVFEPNERILVRCGFKMELAVGFEAQIRPRSGLALKNGIMVVNSPGTIDEGYRGEIGVILLNTGTKSFPIHYGDRIAQMAVRPVPIVRIEVVEELEKSKRGEGGYGSSG